MSETAFADDIKELGDKLVGLTLKKAKELSDYIKEAHGIEPAAGGAVMMAAPSDAPAAAPVEQTEFDVIMTSFGEKKLDVVKVVKNITGASLMDSKKLVEAVPAKIKEGASKDDAAKIKKELEEAGATVELK
ncbi:MAG: 50S ribosomal protein L7/L12 [Pirellulaceae bacterium]|nr:50S ribosomal protein L7/L12 [Pirellulaceae bacterium]